MTTPARPTRRANRHGLPILPGDAVVPVRRCSPCPGCGYHAATFMVRRGPGVGLYRCAAVWCARYFEAAHPAPLVSGPEVLERAERLDDRWSWDTGHDPALLAELQGALQPAERDFIPAFSTAWTQDPRTGKWEAHTL